MHQVCIAYIYIYKVNRSSHHSPQLLSAVSVPVIVIVEGSENRSASFFIFADQQTLVEGIWIGNYFKEMSAVELKY